MTQAKSIHFGDTLDSVIRVSEIVGARNHGDHLSLSLESSRDGSDVHGRYWLLKYDDPDRMRSDYRLVTQLLAEHS